MASCAWNIPIFPPIESRFRLESKKRREERKAKKIVRARDVLRIVRGVGGGVLICSSRENSAAYRAAATTNVFIVFNHLFNPFLLCFHVSFSLSRAAKFTPALNRALRRERSREQRVETHHESRHPRGSLVPPRGLPSFV